MISRPSLLSGLVGLAAVSSGFAARDQVIHAGFDAGAIDRDIAFHQGRVARDPMGAIGWSMLSAAYLAKSKEFDLDSAAWEAEAAARKSLELRRKGNVSAAKRLVSSLLEQHRFQDALLAIDDALTIAPGDWSGTATKADILMELGRLDDAEALLKKMPEHEFVFTPQRARAASLRGRHKDALAMLQAAYAELDKNMDVSRPTLAWFEVKMAGEQLAMGDFGACEASLKSALADHPRSYKACLGMAKLALARKNAAEGSRWASATLEIADSMEAKTLLYTAATMAHHTDEADRWKSAILDQWNSEDAKFGQLQKGGSLQVRPEDRMFATFCREHGIVSANSRTAAMRDLANRPDSLAVENAKVLAPDALAPK